MNINYYSKNYSFSLLLLLFLPVIVFSQSYQVPRTGSTSITTCSGTIMDSGGTGNYQNNSNGYTVINPSVAGNYTQISGTITTEGGYDYLTIYDGTGTGGSILWGGTPHGTGTSCSTFTVPLITSTTGPLTVHFYADGSNRCTGFSLNIDCTTTTGGGTSYCTPTSADSDGLYINNLAFIGTLSDPPANTSTFASNGYQDFTTLPTLAIQAQGEGINITANSTGNVLLRGTWKAWVDWNGDGDFNDSGELIYNIQGFAGSSVTFGFVIPAGQTPGDYRMRIRVNNGSSWLGGETFGFDFSPCDDFNMGSGMFSDDNYGETEDYLFTVIENCATRITSVTNGNTCGSGAVTLNTTGSSGTTQYKWYTNETGGTPIATTTTGTWTTPVLSSTTSYWITASNGSCESVVRTEIIAYVNPTPTLTFTPSNPTVCGENEILELTTSGDTEITHLINETFEDGTLGAFTNINNDTNNTTTDNKTRFQNRASVYVPATNVWFPAISSGFGSNRFAVALSDASSPNYPSAPVQNALTLTNSVNTTDFLDLTLKLKFYYSRYYSGNSNPNDEYIAIELSTNGGATYPTEIARFTSNTGIGTRFVTLNYDLSAFINQTNLKIRVRHYSYAGSGWLPDGVAIDNIELFGTKPLNTAFDWVSSLPVDAFQDAACTIPYTSGTPAVTVYIKPTLAQLEQGIYTFTTSAILSNGCSASDDITITNNSRVWKGSNSTDWNDPNNWSPIGVPTIANCVIIPDNVIINGSNYDAFAKNLNIKNTGNLNNLSNNTLTVKEWVSVDSGGSFILENTSSLIQIDNVANTGNISMKRDINIRKTDYVYWSSPVANFSLGSVSPATTGFKYKWTPTIPTNTNGFGNWSATSETMVLGKGYIVRGPDNYTSTLQNFTATFTGVPNNGNLTSPISRGTYDGADYSTGVSTTLATKDDDNWNLLGNPYPSALNADSFLATNTNIAGFIKLWTHGTLPSAATANPFYQEFNQNYSVTDYVTYNYLGASTPYFDGNIASGQGFYVLMNHLGTAQNENVIFNNAMRSNTYRNDLFYRTDENSVSGQEKSRIWIDLISPSNIASRTLIGYDLEATNSIDRLYDAMALGVKTNFEVYSLCNNERLSIQGRTFDQSDIVPIGLKTEQAGIYTFAINTVDGIFSDANQSIYLEDLNLGIIHDLRSTPYSFTVNTTGTIDNRFNLRYTSNDVLNNQTFSSSENAVKIYPSGNLLQFDSSINNIKEIVIYDVLGKILFNKNYTEKSITVDSLTKTNSTIVIKVILDDNSTVTKKVIF
jgi:hypothetical protein